MGGEKKSKRGRSSVKKIKEEVNRDRVHFSILKKKSSFHHHIVAPPSPKII